MVKDIRASRYEYKGGFDRYGSRGRGRTVYVVHGWDLPFSNKRSTDNFENALVKNGYKVKEINYSMYDPESILRALFELNKLGSGDVVVGHSMGGILNDISNTGAYHIDVSTLHSTIKGTDDWLIGTSSTWVEGGTHGIDQYTDLILDMLDQHYDQMD